MGGSNYETVKIRSNWLSTDRFPYAYLLFLWDNVQIHEFDAHYAHADCGSNDPNLKQEMEKQFVDLLTEELKLQEAVAEEHNRHMNVTFAEAKRIASQYQKEAEKCNAATETCEGARERAEALLIRERKVTLTWERRARQLGWEGE